MEESNWRLLLDIAGAVLYELQPIRTSDAVKLYNFVMAFIRAIWQEGWLLIKNVFVIITEIKVSTILFLVGWFIGWYLFLIYEVAQLYIIVTMFVGIFTNLGTRKDGELSAYSVFNDGHRSLLGSMTADDIDADIRNIRGMRHPSAENGGGFVQFDDIDMRALN